MDQCLEQELNNLLGWSSSADVDDVIERLIANYSKF
jgi:hypothetical protein